MKTLMVQVEDDFQVTEAGAMVLVTTGNAREALPMKSEFLVRIAEGDFLRGQEVTLYAVKEPRP